MSPVTRKRVTEVNEDSNETKVSPSRSETLNSAGDLSIKSRLRSRSSLTGGPGKENVTTPRKKENILSNIDERVPSDESITPRERVSNLKIKQCEIPLSPAKRRLRGYSNYGEPTSLEHVIPEDETKSSKTVINLSDVAETKEKCEDKMGRLNEDMSYDEKHKRHATNYSDNSDGRYEYQKSNAPHFEPKVGKGGEIDDCYISSALLVNTETDHNRDITDEFSEVSLKVRTNVDYVTQGGIVSDVCQAEKKRDKDNAPVDLEKEAKNHVDKMVNDENLSKILFNTLNVSEEPEAGTSKCPIAKPDVSPTRRSPRKHSKLEGPKILENERILHKNKYHPTVNISSKDFFSSAVKVRLDEGNKDAGTNISWIADENNEEFNNSKEDCDSQELETSKELNSAQVLSKDEYKKDSECNIGSDIGCQEEQSLKMLAKNTDNISNQSAQKRTVKNHSILTVEEVSNETSKTDLVVNSNSGIQGKSKAKQTKSSSKQENSELLHKNESPKGINKDQIEGKRQCSNQKGRSEVITDKKDMENESVDSDDDTHEVIDLEINEMGEKEGKHSRLKRSTVICKKVGKEETNDGDKELREKGEEEEEKEGKYSRKRGALQFIDFMAEEGEESDLDIEGEEEEEHEEDDDNDEGSEGDSFQDPKKLAKKFVDDEAKDDVTTKQKHRKRILILESDEETELENAFVGGLSTDLEEDQESIWDNQLSISEKCQEICRQNENLQFTHNSSGFKNGKDFHSLACEVNKGSEKCDEHLQNQSMYSNVGLTNESIVKIDLKEKFEGESNSKLLGQNQKKSLEGNDQKTGFDICCVNDLFKVGNESESDVIANSSSELNSSESKKVNTINTEKNQITYSIVNICDNTMENPEFKTGGILVMPNMVDEQITASGIDLSNTIITTEFNRVKNKVLSAKIKDGADDEERSETRDSSEESVIHNGNENVLSLKSKGKVENENNSVIEESSNDLSEESIDKISSVSENIKGELLASRGGINKDNKKTETTKGVKLCSNNDSNGSKVLKECLDDFESLVELKAKRKFNQNICNSENVKTVTNTKSPKETLKLKVKRNEMQNKFISNNEENLKGGKKEKVLLELGKILKGRNKGASNAKEKSEKKAMSIKANAKALRVQDNVENMHKVDSPEKRTFKTKIKRSNVDELEEEILIPRKKQKKEIKEDKVSFQKYEVKNIIDGWTVTEINDVKYETKDGWIITDLVDKKSQPINMLKFNDRTTAKGISGTDCKWVVRKIKQPSSVQPLCDGESHLTPHWKYKIVVKGVPKHWELQKVKELLQLDNPVTVVRASKYFLLYFKSEDLFRKILFSVPPKIREGRHEQTLTFETLPKWQVSVSNIPNHIEDKVIQKVLCRILGKNVYKVFLKDNSGGQKKNRSCIVYAVDKKCYKSVLQLQCPLWGRKLIFSKYEELDS